MSCLRRFIVDLAMTGADSMRRRRVSVVSSRL